MNKRLIIIGAGGHGKVLAELASSLGNYCISGFFDDGIVVGTEIMPGLKVLGKIHEAENFQAEFFIVAIGNNKVREDLYYKFKKYFEPATLIHPYSSVSLSASIGKGSVILAGAVISYACSIDENCIIGSLVHLDHECKIGAHIYLKAGTLTGSNCKIRNGYCSEMGQIISAYTEI